MNTRNGGALGVGLVVLVLVGSLAVHGADPLPPPAAKVMLAFLGVSVQPVSSTDGKDLGLAEGLGLAVRTVEEQSPAQNRINVGDILTGLDDQILIHPYQLAVLIRTYKPGTEVRVALLRGGNAMDVPVVLGQQEATPLPFAGLGMPMTFTLGQAPGGAIQLHPIGLNGAVTINVAGGGAAAAGAGPGAATVVAVSTGAEQRRTATAVADGVTYSLTSVNEAANYTVTGPDGKVLFSGPAATAEEKARVPEAYRAKLESLLPKTAAAVPAAEPPAAVPAP